jgi:hypothetical protein
MRTTRVLGVLAAVWLLMPAPMVLAQAWPGHGSRGGRAGYGGYGDYGDAGVMGLYTSTLSYDTSRNIAQSNRALGQQAALQQRAMVQSGIRNTLSSQAASQTQNILAQQQSNRDWWFQVQQQQVAQRQATSAASSRGSAPVVGFESAVPAAAPAADTDIIKWLPVLCEPQFAAERAKIEAPYRRDPKTNPTPADYQSMIEAAEQMKVILGQMTAEISAQDYINAEKFLDQLAAEARERIKKDK